MTLLHGLRSIGYGGEVVLSIDSDRHAQVFHDRGATLLLQPFSDAADFAAEQIERATARRAAS